MKKNTRNLLLVLGLVVILGAAVLVLALTGGQEEGESSSASSTELISLISEEEKNLSSVKVTNENGSYIIKITEQEKESSSSSEESDSSSEAEPEMEYIYSIDGVDETVADTDRMESAAAVGLSLNATRNLGKQEKLDDFGLAEPVSTVEVTYRDGSTKTVYIGGSVAGGSGGYYVMVEGDDNVYTASCNDGLFQGSGYYVKTTMFTLQADETTGLIYATHLKLSGTEMPEPIEIEGDDSYVYHLVSPKKAEADSEEVQAIIDGLASISATNVASPDVSEESLKKYGLDEPAGVIEFTVKDQGSYKLSVSAKNEDGTRYALLDGTKAIFIINDSDVSTWLGRTVLSLQSTLNLMPMIQNIKTMTLTVDGKEYAFRLEREEDPESSTEDSKAYTYKVFNKDGKELDYEENFKHFYRSFITNYIIEDYREMPEGDPYVTCTYTYFDSDETNSIAFYKVSDRRYCVVEDGDNVKGLIDPTYLERAVEYLELLNNGEEVPEVY